MAEDLLTLYCTICGAPLIEDERYSKVPLWWNQAIVLSEDLSGTKQICETVANVYHASTLRLSDTGQLITANCTNPFSPKFWVFCLTTHQSCYMILKQNLSQRRPCSGLLRTPGQIWTMRHVWQCLNHRFKATARNGKGDGGPIYRLLAPHNYYMPNISESEWEMNVPIVEADPVVIPDLIEAISRHLRPLPQDQENYPQSSPEVDAFRRHLGRLPVEVMDLIETFIHPLDEPTLSCNRILSPSFWRDGLVSGRLIPFLWDLVPTSAHAQSSALGRINWFKAVTSEEGQQWDWELLVRQLSQPGAFEDGQLFSDVPIGLKNRRRIWRLVEDMYLGDVQPTKKNLWGMAPIPVPVPLPE